MVIYKSFRWFLLTLWFILYKWALSHLASHAEVKSVSLILLLIRFSHLLFYWNNWGIKVLWQNEICKIWACFLNFQWIKNQFSNILTFAAHLLKWFYFNIENRGSLIKLIEWIKKVESAFSGWPIITTLRASKFYHSMHTLSYFVSYQLRIFEDVVIVWVVKVEPSHFYCLAKVTTKV